MLKLRVCSPAKSDFYSACFGTDHPRMASAFRSEEILGRTQVLQVFATTRMVLSRFFIEADPATGPAKTTAKSWWAINPCNARHLTAFPKGPILRPKQLESRACVICLHITEGKLLYNAGMGTTFSQERERARQ